MKYILVLLCFVAKMASAVAPADVKELTIFGVVDGDTLQATQKVIKELEGTETKVLRINITSPGGDAISGFTTAHLLRKLSNKGKVKVEIHALGLCASACTIILASGTPGYRFVEHNTFILVHPIQSGSIMGMKCTDHVAQPKDVEDRIINVLSEWFRDLYMEFTGHPKAVIESWLTCGREQAGMGELAIQLGLADKLDD